MTRKWETFPYVAPEERETDSDVENGVVESVRNKRDWLCSQTCIFPLCCRPCRHGQSDSFHRPCRCCRRRRPLSIVAKNSISVSCLDIYAPERIYPCCYYNWEMKQLKSLLLTKPPERYDGAAIVAFVVVCSTRRHNPKRK